jgi:hypothetical protein
MGHNNNSIGRLKNMAEQSIGGTGKNRSGTGSMAGQDSKAGKEGWGRIYQGQATWQDRKDGEEQIRDRQHGGTGQQGRTRRLGEDRSGPSSMAGQDSQAGQEGRGKTDQDRAAQKRLTRSQNDLLRTCLKLRSNIFKGNGN